MIPFYVSKRIEADGRMSHGGFGPEVVVGQPGREIFVGGPGQSHAPDAIFGSSTANRTLAGAALLAYPHHHEPRPHVPALQADDEPALQLRAHAKEARAAGSNVESFRILRENLALAVQTPEPHRDGYDEASFAPLDHRLTS